jgi:hypothetical protein
MKTKFQRKADPINVKVCMFIQKKKPISRYGRKLKFTRLIEGPPKLDGKVRNQEDFALAVTKWGMEYAMFNFVAESMRFITCKQNSLLGGSRAL